MRMEPVTGRRGPTETGTVQGRRAGGAGRLVLLILLCAACVPAWAGSAPSGSIDAVLVMDSSGSMRHNDPLRLRVPAAKLFISLLGSGDRVGVISFSGRAWPVLGLTAVTGATDQRRLDAAVDKVSSLGAFTNLYAAVDAGRHMLVTQGRPGVRRYLILMSDGRMDVGNARRDARLTHRLLKQLLPQLVREHIQVFSIAFTRSSDIALLRRMAHATHGLFRLAAFDRDLDHTFTTLFERAKRPEMLPIQGGEFTTDASIREVTVVATKQDRAVRIVLQGPGGRQWSYAHRPKDMRWFRSARFDMITVPHPAAGKWRILSSAGHNKAYVVTNLGLDTNVGDQDIALGTDREIHAWLSRGHTVVRQPEVLSDTRFVLEIRRPDGVMARYTMLDDGAAPDGKAGDGVFTTDVEFYKPGAYTLRVLAMAPTFQREITRYFRVDAAPVKSPAAASAASHTASAVPKAHAPPAPKAAAVPAPPPPAAKPAAHAPARASISLWRVALVFLMVNAVLIGLGGGGFLLWKRLTRAKPTTAAADEEPPEGTR